MFFFTRTKNSSKKALFGNTKAFKVLRLQYWNDFHKIMCGTDSSHSRDGGMGVLDQTVIVFVKD